MTKMILTAADLDMEPPLGTLHEARVVLDVEGLHLDFQVEIDEADLAGETIEAALVRLAQAEVDRHADGIDSIGSYEPMTDLEADGGVMARIRRENARADRAYIRRWS